jgi:NADPH:quinone reductase-like Zn-dependent oxidoreductase
LKAWTLNDFGIDNLVRSDVPTPEPGPRQLLVEVGAVSLNFRDKAIAEGLYEPDRMPKTSSRPTPIWTVGRSARSSSRCESDRFGRHRVRVAV